MFDFYFDPSAETIGLALIILALRIVNNALGTIRLVMVSRGQRWPAAIIGFLEALIFAVTVSSVVTDLSNVILLFSYCLGFALGGYVGMALESRLVTSYMSVNIFTHNEEAQLAEKLRAQGYGVTKMLGEGRDGTVTVLRSIITHRDVRKLMSLVREIDPHAFVLVEETRSVLRGWIQTERGHRR